MTISLNFNASSVLTQFQLSRSEQSLNRVFERLSSGVKLARSADGPGDMVIANALRYQREGVDRSAANAEEGVSMIQTADSSMDQIGSLLTRLRELALNAANDVTQDVSQLQALQSELDNAIDSITRIAQQASFSGVNMLTGDLSGVTMSDDARDVLSDFSLDWRRLPGGVQADSTLSVAPANVTLDRDRVSATFVGPPLGTAAIVGSDQGGTILAAGGRVDITGPLGTQAIVVSGSTTFDDFVTLVNAQTTNTGARAQYDETTGVLTVESTSYGTGTLTLSSEIMGGIVGLLDSDGRVIATDPTLDVTNSLLTAAPLATIDMDYVDGVGTARTVVLTQDPTSTNGLTFTNLLGADTSPLSTYIAEATFPGALPGTTPILGQTQNGVLLDAPGTMTITGPLGSLAVPITVLTTFDDVVNAVNAATLTLGATATYNTSTGVLHVESTGYAGGSMTIDSTDMTTALSGVGLLDSDTTTATNDLLVQTLIYTMYEPGAFSVTLLDDDGSFGSTLAPAASTVTATRVSSYAFQLGVHADERAIFELPDMRAGALGHSANLATDDYASLQRLKDLQSLVNGDYVKALTVIDAAINEVSNARGRAGALQANRVETTMSALRNNSQNLLQTESTLRDTDFARESAELAKQQILMQAATAMLAQANQVPQSVLQLLK